MEIYTPAALKRGKLPM